MVDLFDDDDKHGPIKPPVNTSTTVTFPDRRSAAMAQEFLTDVDLTREIWSTLERLNALCEEAHSRHIQVNPTAKNHPVEGHKARKAVYGASMFKVF